MLDNFKTIFGQMTIVIFFMAIGYLFNKKQLIPAQAKAAISKMVALLFLPAMLFNTFLTRCTRENFKEYGVLILYGAGTVLVMILLSYPISRLVGGKDQDKVGATRYSVVTPNTGSVGQPLSIALFGTMGLFQYNLFNMFNTIACYSWGISQLLPEKKKTFKQTLVSIFSPSFSAVLIGGILALIGIGEHIPQIFLNAFNTLGGCYTPCALFLTGFTIAEYRPSEVLKDRSVYLMTAIRLVVLPCAAILCMKAIHAPLIAVVMVFLQTACPCGANTVIFPAANGKDSRFGASSVLVSHVLSTVTVPLIYALMIAE